MPIVGRSAERAVLSGAYARAAAGEPQVLLITGPAGIGKTRLVEELCQQASQAGARVLAGESAPLAGAALAYGPFVAALGEQAPWLLDDDRPDDMLSARHRLFVRVLGLLGDLAAAGPLALVLEDLHWADESSRELMAFLAVRLRRVPVLLAATVRDEDLDSGQRRWLTEMQRRPGVRRLRLAGLADAEIAELVTRLFPDGVSADQVAAVVSAAGGNPLYALELASARPTEAPASIAEAVLARAAGLTDPARAVADQVSVADGGMSHDLLAATAALEERLLLAGAKEAVASGLLVAEDDGYAFSHGLIRQVLYDHLLPGERRRLHRSLAEALAARAGVSQGSLAQHWHLAGCQDRAAAAALTAARQAVSARAYPEAVRDYALAIDLESWLPQSGPELFEEAAQAASWAGDPERAAGMGRRGARHSPVPSPRTAGCGCWSGSGGTGGRLVTRVPPRMPAKKRWHCSPAARRRRCVPGCSPRWPPTGCCLVNSSRRCRSRSRPWRRHGRRARLPRRRTAWPPWASSWRRAATPTPGWRRCGRPSASRGAPAARKTRSGRRPTTCTCCARPGGSPRHWRWPPKAGRPPGPWARRRR